MVARKYSEAFNLSGLSIRDGHKQDINGDAIAS